MGEFVAGGQNHDEYAQLVFGAEFERVNGADNLQVETKTGVGVDLALAHRVETEEIESDAKQGD